jgi:hypothetical protein
VPQRRLSDLIYRTLRTDLGKASSRAAMRAIATQMRALFGCGLHQVSRAGLWRYSAGRWVWWNAGAKSRVDHGHGEGVFVRVNACEHPVFSPSYSGCSAAGQSAGISRGYMAFPHAPIERQQPRRH